MSQYNNNSSDKLGLKNPWKQTMLATAVVAGFFSFILLIMLTANYINSNTVYPLKSERLEMLKLKLSENPQNEQLLNQIRKLDLEIREYSLYKTEFTRKVTVFLFIGIILFVISLQLYLSLDKKISVPESDSDRGREQVVHSYLSRASLAGAMILLSVLTLYLFYNSEASDGDSQAVEFPSPERLDKHWVRFRGPEGAGISRYTNVPMSWNEQEDENIIWKSPIEFLGFNSPIVWKDMVFLSGADKEELKVFCYSLEDGSLLWESNVPTTAISQVEVMEDTGYAAPTMVTNGVYVYAIFATGDIAGFDMNGKMVWHKFLSIPDNIYGYSSSLMTFDKKVIVQFDEGMADEGKSRLIVLDSITGVIIKEVDRPVGASWTSPIICETNSADGEDEVIADLQLITAAKPYVISYNPVDMSEIWRVSGIGADAAASPIYSAGLVLCLSPYDNVFAVDPLGRGDITDTHIKWTSNEGMPDIASPVSDGERIYMMQTYGTLTCLDIDSGESLWQHDMGTSFQASPVLAGDKIYFVGAEGTSFVIEAGNEYKQVSKCQLEEGAYASPAFVDGKIIIRTKGHLYCIGFNQ